MEIKEHELDTGRATVYFVNGENQETQLRDLTVRQILDHAGFRPPEQYRLIRDAGHKVFANLDEQIEIHEQERFTALFEGPTPTS